MYMHIIAWRHLGLTYDLNSALSNIIFSSSMSRTNKYDIFNYVSSNLKYHQWSSYEMQKSKLFVLYTKLSIGMFLFTYLGVLMPKLFYGVFYCKKKLNMNANETFHIVYDIDVSSYVKYNWVLTVHHCKQKQLEGLAPYFYQE